MYQRVLIDTTNMPVYVAEYLEAFLKQYGGYMISDQRYVKLTQDEKTLDYLNKREVPPA